MAAGTPRKDNYPVYNNYYYNRQSEFYKMECIRSNLKKKSQTGRHTLLRRMGVERLFFYFVMALRSESADSRGNRVAGTEK